MWDFQNFAVIHKSYFLQPKIYLQVSAPYYLLKKKKKLLNLNLLKKKNELIIVCQPTYDTTYLQYSQ